MNPTILALSTAVPPHFYKQDDLANLYLEIFSLPLEKQEFIKNVFENSAIEKRHSVIGDFNYPREKWDFWCSIIQRTYPECRGVMTFTNRQHRCFRPLRGPMTPRRSQPWSVRTGESGVGRTALFRPINSTVC